ncbi:single-stranded DNA-binding protein [Helicobacter sp. 23-1048]
MYNKVIIIGNLTRDIEDIRYLPSGSAVATLGLASNRRYNKQDGTKGEETCFVDVKLFGRTAEVAKQYLRKGSKVLIEGRLNFESWSDQSGQKRSKHTIIAESMQMLDSKGGGEYTQSDGYSQDSQNQGYQNSQPRNTQGNAGGYNQNIPEIDINDEDIPF